MNAFPAPDTVRMPRSLVLLFAAASGLSVANVYYAQPLLEALAADFGISHAAVGGVVTATQAGCALALLLPVAAGRQHIGMDTMAPAAHFAVHGPDHQRVAAVGFECIQIFQAALQRLGVAWPEHPRPHLRRRHSSGRRLQSRTGRTGTACRCR